jgi:hypothetical protein
MYCWNAVRVEEGAIESDAMEHHFNELVVCLAQAAHAVAALVRWNVFTYRA